MIKATHCAYCWACGTIEVGKVGSMPWGAVEIARGPEAALNAAVQIAASKPKEDEADKLLVPGVCDAADQDAGADAVKAFVKWCKKSLRFADVTFGIRVLP